MQTSANNAKEMLQAACGIAAGLGSSEIDSCRTGLVDFREFIATQIVALR